MGNFSFKLNQENRIIIKAVIHIIKTVQKSGISKKMKKSIAFNTKNIRKNSLLFICSFFLVIQLAKNITYANLKNSEG